MSFEGLPPSSTSPTERRMALLHYIRKIAVEEQANTAKTMDLERFLELADGATATHHRTVNNGLKSVEGIPAYLGPTDGDQLPIVLKEWHGIDPDNAENHLWTVTLQDGSEAGMTVSFPADELHQETLERLTTDG